MSIGNVYQRVRLRQEINRIKLIKTGISFLDEAVGGILPDALWVIGASTGSGKTQLSTILAENSAKKGLPTRLLALERGRDEVHSRMLYPRVAQYFFSHISEFPEGTKLSWLAFFYGHVAECFDALIRTVADKMKAELTELDIIPDSSAGPDWNRKDISTVYKEVCESSRLIILDHLHMLRDCESDRGELDAVAENMRTLRQLIYSEEVPMIVFSHLRKRNFQSPWVVPPLEELHGSSEISKRADVVVTISRAAKLPTKDGSAIIAPEGSTWVRVCKARHAEVGATDYAALMTFDFKTMTYKENYTPYLCNYMGSELKPCDYKDFEPWMQSARVTNG